MSNAADATLQPDATPATAPPTPAPTMPPRSVTELGVVDPIRIPPAFTRAVASFRRRAWDPLPPVAKLFVALSALDIAWRAIGFAGTGLFISLESPISIVSTFLPHNLLIALPALVLARRADAAVATPLVLGGAVVLALVELLWSPFSNAAFGSGGDGAFVIGSIVQVGALVLKSVGWLALAYGLIAITAGKPSPFLGRLGNLVFAFLAAGAVVGLVSLLVSPFDLGDPGWDAMQGIAAVVALVELVVFGFLARVIVHGTLDERRPAEATTVASGAVVMAAITGMLAAGVSLVAIVARSPDLGGATQAFAWVGYLGDAFAKTLLFVAFGLGLADNTIRLRASAPPVPDAELLDDDPAWPELGRDVPAYLTPAAPDSAPSRRRAKSPSKPASRTRRSKRPT